MEIITGIENIKRTFRNPVVTLGNFDGVHLGHQKIFNMVMEEAARLRGEGLVITFAPHPLQVLTPEKFLPLLTPFEKKVALIERSGIDAVLCIEFSLNFSKISPAEFIRNILVEKLRIKKVIIGYNYHFGKGQGGDAQTLREAGKGFHFDVEIADPLKVGEIIVSSSKIRDLILRGEIEQASALLGRGYFIEGKVVEGAKRGQTLGFPTANLDLSGMLYPKPGVYAVEIVWKQERFNGLANIGFNPTFVSPAGEKDGRASMEVHLFNFDRNIYGEEIEVHFKKRIRDEARFESPSLLIQQIEKDIQYAKENIFRT